MTGNCMAIQISNRMTDFNPRGKMMVVKKGLTAAKYCGSKLGNEFADDPSAATTVSG